VILPGRVVPFFTGIFPIGVRRWTKSSTEIALLPRIGAGSSRRATGLAAAAVRAKPGDDALAKS
jgi:hypothetical protein